MKKKILNNLVWMGAMASVLVLSECKTSSKVVATKPATTAPAPVVTAPDTFSVAVGRTIFETNCDRCHEQPKPGDHDQSEWIDIMAKMALKAHLSNDQTNAVLVYLKTTAKQ